MAHNPLIAAIQIANKTFLLPPGKRELDRRVKEFFPEFTEHYAPLIKEFIQVTHALLHEHNKAAEIALQILTRKGPFYKSFTKCHKSYIQGTKCDLAESLDEKKHYEELLKNKKNSRSTIKETRTLLNNTKKDIEYSKKQISKNSTVIKSLGTLDLTDEYDLLMDSAEKVDAAINNPTSTNNAFRSLTRATTPDPLVTSIKLSFSAFKQPKKKFDFDKELESFTNDDDYHGYYGPIIRYIAKDLTELLGKKPKLSAVTILEQTLTSTPQINSIAYKTIKKSIDSYIKDNGNVSKIQKDYELDDYETKDLRDNIDDISQLLSQNHSVSEQSFIDLVEQAESVNTLRAEMLNWPHTTKNHQKLLNAHNPQ
jgi:hypothetical protein